MILALLFKGAGRGGFDLNNFLNRVLFLLNGFLGIALLEFRYVSNCCVFSNFCCLFICFVRFLLANLYLYFLTSLVKTIFTKFFNDNDLIWCEATRIFFASQGLMFVWNSGRFCCLYKLCSWWCLPKGRWPFEMTLWKPITLEINNCNESALRKQYSGVCRFLNILFVVECASVPFQNSCTEKTIADKKISSSSAKTIQLILLCARNTQLTVV